MASIYPPNNPGPWLCNDEKVTCNGYFKDGVHAASTSVSGPTCNGVGPNEGVGSSSWARGWLQRGMPDRRALTPAKRHW